MLTLKEITALDTYSVRHPVLREGKPLESCHFEGDNLQSTIHLGLYINCALIGVVSLFKNKNEAENYYAGFLSAGDFFSRLEISDFENFYISKRIGHE